jgi:signal transduction histidine kinase
MERGVLAAVAVLRWAAWIWLTAVAAANLRRVEHPVVALLAVTAAGLVTVAAQAALKGPGWRRALGTGLVVTEVVVAIAVVAADGWVRQGRITGQSLAGTWPLAAVLVAAVAGGAVWGAATGALLGAARTLAVVAAGVGPGQVGRTATATASTVMLWIVVGAAVGTMIGVLRDSQDQLAEAAVRERMARDLHDGVLQTLTLIERRSPSSEIARLAREQERELRSYLFGDSLQPQGLAAGLRAVAARAERTWPDLAVTVTVSDDVPPLPLDAVMAATGAAAEALTNAAKHGRAQRVVVFADIDDGGGGLFLTIKDDGTGFDVVEVSEGAGMASSIRGRLDQVGGGVEFASELGEGAEVRITIPAIPRRKRNRG